MNNFKKNTIFLKLFINLIFTITSIYLINNVYSDKLNKNIIKSI